MISIIRMLLQIQAVRTSLLISGFGPRTQVSHIVPLHKQRRPRRYIKYNLYFYSSTASFVRRRNTVKESSHISFSVVGILCVLERQPENTHKGADGFPCVTSGSLSQPKITYLILSFNSHEEIWTHVFAYVFFVNGWLSELIYFRFFPVICWSFLRTEISVTLSTGNKLHPPLFFSFLWNHFVDVILRPHWIR